MSSDNPISDVSKGVTEALLEWTTEKITILVKKFKDRKLAFIQEPRTIEIAREQYRSGESKFYEIYIKNKDVLFLVRMGLTLRKLENDRDRLQNLRDKIFKKYKTHGLHVAEFVQNGVLNRYVGIKLEELSSVEDLKKEIEDVLKNIEKHAIFVLGREKAGEIIKKVVNVVHANSPDILIVSGIKSAAEIVRTCTQNLEEHLKEYNLEKFSTVEKETLFFKKTLTK